MKVFINLHSIKILLYKKVRKKSAVNFRKKSKLILKDKVISDRWK
jgi:hypothetical protein